MNEISVILKNNSLVTVEEFKVLDQYSCYGKLWTVVDRPTPDRPYLITYKTTEYIFDPESLTVFCILSRNVLAYWKTECTRYLNPNDEFHLTGSIFIRSYRHR